MSQAFIANELKTRLLEHAPNAILSAKKLELLSAEIEKNCLLPYKKAEFDSVIAPLVFIEQENVTAFFEEIHRILVPNGVFLFSTLGKEVPYELEQLGDALSKAGFQFPVVDREIVQLQYDDINVLLKDLEQSNLNEKSVRVIKKSSEDIMATLNVIYGYALGSIDQKALSGKIEIPIETIKIRKPL